MPEDDFLLSAQQLEEQIGLQAGQRLALLYRWYKKADRPDKFFDAVLRMVEEGEARLLDRHKRMEKGFKPFVNKLESSLSRSS